MTATDPRSVHKLATGLGFTEGPAVLADGRIAATSNETGLISYFKAGALQSQIDVGGGVTGLAEDARGRLYYVQNCGFWGAPKRAEAMLGVIEDGRPRPFLTAPLRAPNDLCFGPDGLLYLTDPIAEEGLGRPVAAKLYAVDLESGRATCLRDDLFFPNGIAFDAEDRLYVAESQKERILRFEFDAGNLGEPSVFAVTRDGVPDGMAFDAQGDLWVAVNAADALQVFAPDGSLARVIELGEGAYPSNLCFQGTTVIVTTAGWGAVSEFDAGLPGLSLHPFRTGRVDQDGGPTE